MKRAAVITVIAVIAGAAALSIFLLSGGLPESKANGLTMDEVKAQALNVSYADLVKNNGQYVGKIVYFRGQVTQIFETKGDFSVILVAVRDPGSNILLSRNAVWLNFIGPQLNEGDFIDIWGRVEGMKTYRPADGSRTTLPEITLLNGAWVS
jgi:hypothetical protein